MTVLIATFAVLVLVPILTALAVVIACRVHDRRQRRREVAERLPLLTVIEIAPDTDAFTAGRARLDAALRRLGDHPRD